MSTQFGRKTGIDLIDSKNFGCIHGHLFFIGYSLTDDLQLRHLGRLDVPDTDLGGELFDDVQEIRPRGRAGKKRLFHLAGIAGLAEENVERHLAQEGYAELLRQGRLAPPWPKR